MLELQLYLEKGIEIPSKYLFETQWVKNEVGRSRWVDPTKSEWGEKEIQSTDSVASKVHSVNQYNHSSHEQNTLVREGT